MTSTVYLKGASFLSKTKIPEINILLYEIHQNQEQRILMTSCHLILLSFLNLLTMKKHD